MDHPGFFDRSGPFTLTAIAEAAEADIVAPGDGDTLIDDVRPLNVAGPRHVSFFDNRRYLSALSETSAAACIVAAQDVGRLPDGVVALRSRSPYRSFARALTLFYADARHSKAARFAADANLGMIHPSATLADGVVIEPGAIVGREAVIGANSTICAGAVVGYRVVIGSNGYIGPSCTVTHAILGDNVILHAGVRIGQDGFGFAMGNGGHDKVPQIGRVLIGDNVEIGANTTIDRGALTDTIVGSGTKIDNLVQIGHNVVIGRHCVIVAQSGIAGSTELGDFVVMGAQSGVLGHVKVGSGAQIAGMSHAKDDVPKGARMGGTPAVPFGDWARQVAAVRRLGRLRSDRT
ncbi:MAG: UDP-3-O-(3-hydroxymyristoyl)glucosamine N-acyltransferase [Hyphomicrobium sp.]|nr:UDP-3-O-(3-hydroxymyristoyl)glucosamine N-acyltransferase [Hyphomicrobium sp.]